MRLFGRYYDILFLGDLHRQSTHVHMCPQYEAYLHEEPSTVS